MSVFAEEAASSEGELPRYKLKVGQELHYSGKGTFKYDSGSFDSANDWKIWVARENEDGSHRLIVRQAAAHNSQDTSGEDASVTLAYLDLFPDGRFAENASFGYRMNPHVLFARLPSDENEARNGWESRSETSDTTYRYTATAPDMSSANDWKFTQVEDGPFNKIYESTSEATVTFDRAQGLVREINGKNTQGWGFNGEGTNSMKLENVGQQDAAWIAKLDSDMERYLAASKQYEESLKGLELAVTEAESRLKEAKQIWTAAREEVTSEIVQEAIDRQIAQHDSYSQYRIDDVQKRAEVLGKPAADWESTDLEGKAHRLADYAGKVVVLDFWYRGCGWCIRAMPQINQVAEEYADQPVAVLGMNTDSNLDDAKFVAEAMKLKYPSIRIDRELPQKYGVSGFPTMLVIDQAGVVRDMHVGYSPTLREDLNASIDRLLKSDSADAVKLDEARSADANAATTSQLSEE
ncbi:MAG TPA: TlpA disulfide reductase family protein [Lacipirellulaceae bacterium]|nr:TlpA disulfide reductase family protein [Lacipirellulaceae bacterium]